MKLKMQKKNLFNCLTYNSVFYILIKMSYNTKQNDATVGVEDNNQNSFYRLHEEFMTLAFVM